MAFPLKEWVSLIEEYQPGEHILSINTSDISSGVYILNVISGETSIQKNIVVAK